MEDNRAYENEMLDSQSNINNTSNLILVKLDYNDGFKCEMLLEPGVINRLQNGDMELMEQLRSSYASTPEAGIVNAATITDNREPYMLASQDAMAEQKGNISKRKICVKTENAAYSDNKKIRLLNTESVVLNEGLLISPSNTFEQTGADSLKMESSKIVNAELDLAGIEFVNEAGEPIIIQGSPTVTKTESENNVSISNKMDYSADVKFPLKRKVNRPRRYLKYTLEQRDQAVEEVLSGKLTHFEAAKKYNIPSGTLFHTVKNVGGPQFKCGECQLGFPLKYMLIKHLRSHSKDRKLLCYYCAASFRDEKGLKKHIFHCHPDNALEDFREDYIKHTKRYKNAKWTFDTTNLLIRWYSDFVQKGDQEVLQTMEVWDQLAERFDEIGHYVTGKQVKYKWKMLITYYNSFLESGMARRPPKCYKELQQFLKINGDRYFDNGQEPDSDDDANKGPTVLWNETMVIALVDEYEARIQDFQKPDIKRKYIWESIAKSLCSKGINFNAVQVEGKWKGLKKIHSSWLYVEDEDSLKAADDRYAKWGWRLRRLIEESEQVARYSTASDFSHKKTIDFKTNDSAVSFPKADSLNLVLLDELEECLLALENYPVPLISENHLWLFLTAALSAKGYYRDKCATKTMWDEMCTKSESSSDTFNLTTEEKQLRSRIENVKTKLSQLLQEHKFCDYKDFLFGELAMVDSVGQSNEEITDNILESIVDTHGELCDHVEEKELNSSSMAKLVSFMLHKRKQFICASAVKNAWEKLLSDFRQGLLSNVTVESKIKEVVNNLMYKRSYSSIFFLLNPSFHCEASVKKQLLQQESDLTLQPETDYSTGKSWNPDAVEMLLNLLESSQIWFKNRQGLKRRVYWEQLSSILCKIDSSCAFTPQQVEGKYKGLKKQYKATVKQMESGQRTRVTYFNLLERVFGKSSNVNFDENETSVTDASNELYNFKPPKQFPVEIFDHKLTQKLLDEFEANIDQYNNSMMKKKKFWQLFTNKLNSKISCTLTPSQVEGKMKGLRATYNKKKKKANGRYWPYMEQMDRITNLEPKDETALKKADAVSTIWSDEQTKVFLDEMETNIDSFRDTESDNFWEKTSDSLTEQNYNCSSLHCLLKWNELLQSYNLVLSKRKNSTETSDFMFINQVERLLNQMTNSEDYKSGDNAEDKWPVSALVCLVNSYRAYMSLFYQHGVATTQVWHYISDLMCQHGFIYTGQQCQYTWKKTLRLHSQPTSSIVYASGITQVLNMERNIKTTFDAKEKKWEDREYQLLFTEYGSRLDMFDDENSDKNMLWGEIAQVFCDELDTNVTADELMAKWSTTVQQYREALQNKEAGLAANFEYMDSMGELLGINPEQLEITSQVMRSYMDGNDSATGEVDDDIDENCDDSDEIDNGTVSISYIKVEKDNYIECEISSPANATIKGEKNEPVSSTVTNQTESKSQNEEEVGSPPKKKGRGKIKIIQEVMKYLHEYERKRDELESKRVEEISKLHEEKLTGVQSVGDMVQYIKEYEAKREQMERERTNDLAQMQAKKMQLLTKLLEN